MPTVTNALAIQKGLRMYQLGRITMDEYIEIVKANSSEPAKKAATRTRKKRADSSYDRAAEDVKDGDGNE